MYLHTSLDCDWSWRRWELFI